MSLPMEKYQNLKQTIEKISNLCGLSIANPSSKWDFMTVLCLVAIIVYHIMTWYTWFVRASDTLFVLKTAILYGIGCQAAIRFSIYVTKPQVLLELMQQTDELYEKNVDTMQRKVMGKCIDQAIFAFKLLVGLYLACVSLFLINPLYDFIFNLKKSLIFPYEIPFVSIESSWGFGVTFALHIIMEFYMLLGLSTIDGAFIFYGMQVCGIVDLIKIEFDMLANHLENGEYKDVSKKLQKIVVSHQKMNSFLESVNEFFNTAALSVISTSIMSICVGLIAVIFIKWYAAFGFLIAVLFQLFITCIIGTIIQNQQEKFLTEIVWNFPWYLLKVPERKMYLFMLAKAQKPKIIRLKLIGPLNMETFLKISSDILILQENKITLLVITLVVFFLICHTPNAVYSLYKSSWLNSSQTSPSKIKNNILAFEISCQILMSINCCSKIFVYLMVYDEYWKSLKSLKNCFRCSSGGAPREQIINTSKHLFPSTKADVESLLNYSLNKKRYATEIPPEARHYRTVVPNHRTPKASITPRLSLTPSAEGIEMGTREENRISTQPQVERQPSMRSNLSFKALHLSPSQASLSRSKSLNIQSTMKHSPNCRLNKKL